MWRMFLSTLVSATPGLPQIFDFLFSLIEKGMNCSSILVYLAAISTHHCKVDGFTVFSHPDSKWFPSMATNKDVTVNLAFAFVLNILTRKPFEPLAAGPQHLVVWKIATIQLGEWENRGPYAITPPYLCFLNDGISFFPDISFLPKVVSQSHLQADIILPTFFPELKDGEKPWVYSCLGYQTYFTLLLLMHQIISEKSASLHCLCGSQCKGKDIISKQIVESIKICYPLAKLPLSGPIKPTPQELCLHPQLSLKVWHLWLKSVL